MKINRKMYGVHFLNEVNSLCLGYILKSLFQLFALPVPLSITQFYLQYLEKALHKMPPEIKGHCCEEKENHFSMLVSTKN